MAQGRLSTAPDVSIGVPQHVVGSEPGQARMTALVHALEQAALIERVPVYCTRRPALTTLP